MVWVCGVGLGRGGEGRNVAEQGKVNKTGSISFSIGGIVAGGALALGEQVMSSIAGSSYPMAIPLAWLCAGGGIIFDLLTKESKYEKLFRMCGLENKNKHVPLVIKKQKNGTQTTLIVHMPDGISQKQFEDKQIELEQGLNCKIEFGFNKNLIMKLIEMNLSTKYDYEFRETKNPLEVFLGYSDVGPYYLDIEKSQHIIIGGATDSGKSSGISDIALSLILNSHNVDLHLHDFQNISLGMFEQCKKVKSYGVTPAEFNDLLKQMEQECEDRLKLFRSVKNKVYVDKLSTWNQVFPEKALPYKVVLVDEFGRLADSEFESILNNFRARVQMDRKAGIHYIIVLHRCSVDMLSGSIKNNMPTRISYRTASKTDSKVILDEEGAEKLKCQGRCLVMNYDGLKEVQSLYIDPKDVMKFLKQNKGYKTIEETQLEKNIVKQKEQAEKDEAKAARDKIKSNFHQNHISPYKGVKSC